MNQRIAIAIEEQTAEEIVTEHFGRCSKFYVCELDDQNKLLKTETYFNPLSGENGSVDQLPAYVKQFNVNAIITGIIEQKAVSKFLSFGIDVITAPGIVYEQALQLYINGNLSESETFDHS